MYIHSPYRLHQELITWIKSQKEKKLDPWRMGTHQNLGTGPRPLLAEACECEEVCKLILKIWPNKINGKQVEQVLTHTNAKESLRSNSKRRSDDLYFCKFISGKITAVHTKLLFIRKWPNRMTHRLMQLGENQAAMREYHVGSAEA